jgi:hypothetical protein
LSDDNINLRLDESSAQIAENITDQILQNITL